MRSVALTALGFLVAGLMGTGAYFLPVLSAVVSDTGQSIARTLNNTASPGASANPATTDSSVPVTSGQPFTMLLLGSDNGERFQGNQVLTQSMILVRVDPGTKHVVMLSIPRDLYVPLSTGGTDKIDKAYLYGGASAAVATVEQNFHVHVDHYAWIGLQGLITLIDKVGGVDVITSNPILDDEYPTDINNPNAYGSERIALMAGPQHFDGATALEYVRSRHDDLRGDFGRSERQQQVLLALRAKAGSIGIADLPDIAAAMNGQFSTDLGAGDVRALMPLVASIDLSSVERYVLLPPATSDASVGGQDVLMPNWQVINDIVSRGFPGG